MMPLTKQLILSLGITLLASSALTGCTSSYNHVEITEVSQGSITPTTLSLQEITVPVGGIAIAKVIPYNSDQNPMVGIITSDHPEVLFVEGATNNKWAFSGVSAGSSTVKFMADGAVVATVIATVSVQGN